MLLDPTMKDSRRLYVSVRRSSALVTVLLALHALTANVAVWFLAGSSAAAIALHRNHRRLEVLNDELHVLREAEDTMRKQLEQTKARIGVLVDTRQKRQRRTTANRRRESASHASRIAAATGIPVLHRPELLASVPHTSS